MDAVVVNVKHDEYDVYIGRGRGSRWGNQYSHRDIPGTKQVATREEAIERFRQDLWFEIRHGVRTREELAALHGKRLGCWCKPAACHGDVLAKAAAWAHEQLQA